MGFCVECRDSSPGPLCYRCGSTTVDETPVVHSEGRLGANRAAALCYLGWFITGVLFMVLPPYSRNRTVRFHAYQSILLTSSAMVIIFCAALYVPFRYREVTWWAIQVSLLTVWIATMISAWMGRKLSLPFIGSLAEKQLITSGL
jgi:uncharacterized membrane protein